jgi:hypothetical protein
MIPCFVQTYPLNDQIDPGLHEHNVVSR